MSQLGTKESAELTKTRSSTLKTLDWCNAVRLGREMGTPWGLDISWFASFMPLQSESKLIFEELLIL
jgi:hypothetical protein